jgi:hypothetical protein
MPYNIDLIEHWYYYNANIFFKHDLQLQTYLSTATAQRICDPTAEAVGVHVKLIDHNVVVFRTIGVLMTIGNERVAISIMLVELGQKFSAMS